MFGRMGSEEEFRATVQILIFFLISQLNFHSSLNSINPVFFIYLSSLWNSLCSVRISPLF